MQRLLDEVADCSLDGGRRLVDHAALVLHLLGLLIYYALELRRLFVLLLDRLGHLLERFVLLVDFELELSNCRFVI